MFNKRHFDLFNFYFNDGGDASADGACDGGDAAVFVRQQC